MVNSVFVDTLGWLTLRDKSESRHVEVSDYYRRARLENRRIITSDYVLDETITLLFRRLPFSQATHLIYGSHFYGRDVRPGYREHPYGRCSFFACWDGI